MIREIINDDNIKNAYESFKDKSNSSGKDGIALKDVYEYYHLNKDRILEDIESKRYKCRTIVLNEMLDYKGKHRLIAKLCSIDRLLLKALSIELEKRYDNLFSNYSYAYRKGFGLTQAVNQIYEYVKEFSFVSIIDISNYFDNIDHDILYNLIHKIIHDDIVEAFINSYVNCEVEYDFQCFMKTKGLIQGSSISPFFSNLYLNELDHYLEKENIMFVRYGDNIYLFSNDKVHAYDYFNRVKQKLESLYHLSINKLKSGIYESYQPVYLGYIITRVNNKYDISKKTRLDNKYYKNWHNSSLSYANNEYHILDDGILRRKDYSILFENETKQVHIPVNVIDHINIYSEVIFSSNFFCLMNERNVIINMFNRNNQYVGSFIPVNNYKSINTALNQMRKYIDGDKRLYISKRIVNAQIHNQRSNIKYYYKQYHKDELKKLIDIVSNDLKKVNECKTQDELLLLEARSKKTYYSAFQYIINNDSFKFNQRTRQPPQDCINALISYGNTILYTKIADEIRKTTLDIRVGFQHSSNNRKQTLNLDIADIFKPIIVDRTIFMLINKKIITKQYFEERNNGVYLTNKGKAIFIYYLREKLYTHIKYKNQEITYFSIIKENIYAFMSYINSNVKLSLFKYQ